MNSYNAILSKFAITLFMLVGVVADANAISEDDLIEGYSHGYNASGKLSKADFKMLVKFELLQADWNSTLAPLVRGLRDPNLDPSQWARGARRTIDEMTEIRLKMSIAAAQIEDHRPREIVKEIDMINSQMLIAWDDIRTAMANGDNDAYRRAGMKAQQLAQEKAGVAGPVLRRLREKFGDKVIDGAIERELRELARKTGLR
jgi:hypothetical protein